MSDFILPTTPGSIIKFTDWADVNHTETFTFVATLVPGAITETGTHDLIWTDAFVQGEQSEFPTERILSSNPEVIYEADALAPKLDLIPSPRPGQVVTYLDQDDDIRLTVTYTPGLLSEDGSFSEEDCFWVNSYGSTVKLDTILALAPIVHSAGMAV